MAINHYAINERTDEGALAINRIICQLEGYRVAQDDEHIYITNRAGGQAQLTNAANRRFDDDDLWIIAYNFNCVPHYSHKDGDALALLLNRKLPFSYEPTFIKGNEHSISIEGTDTIFRSHASTFALAACGAYLGFLYPDGNLPEWVTVDKATLQSLEGK